MRSFGTTGRVLATLAVAAALGIPGALPGPSAAATAQSADCVVVYVKGQPVQTARRMLARNGCRNVVVRKTCTKDTDDFGRVLRQKPEASEKPYPAKTRVTLWVGMRQTEDGQICGELPDTSEDATPYDGTYAVTILIQGGPAGGHTVVDLSFTVTDGRMSGDFNGTVNASGVSTDATGVVAGGTCRLTGDMQFADGRATGPMACSGELAFTGVLTAIRR